MTWDEVKNRISLALKDKEPILRKGFEIICKENAELKEKYDTCLKENTGLKIHNAYVEKKLTNATEIIKKLRALYFSPVVTKDDVKKQDEILAEAEQFISEVEK